MSRLTEEDDPIQSTSYADEIPLIGSLNGRSLSASDVNAIEAATELSKPKTDPDKQMFANLTSSQIAELLSKHAPPPSKPVAARSPPKTDLPPPPTPPQKPASAAAAADKKEPSVGQKRTLKGAAKGSSSPVLGVAEEAERLKKARATADEETEDADDGDEEPDDDDEGGDKKGAKAPKRRKTVPKGKGKGKTKPKATTEEAAAKLEEQKRKRSEKEKEKRRLDKEKKAGETKAKEKPDEPVRFHAPKPTAIKSPVMASMTFQKLLTAAAATVPGLTPATALVPVVVPNGVVKAPPAEKPKAAEPPADPKGVSPTQLSKLIETIRAQPGGDDYSVVNAMVREHPDVFGTTQDTQQFTGGVARALMVSIACLRAHYPEEYKRAAEMNPTFGSAFQMCFENRNNPDSLATLMLMSMAITESPMRPAVQLKALYDSTTISKVS